MLRGWRGQTSGDWASHPLPKTVKFQMIGEYDEYMIYDEYAHNIPWAHHGTSEQALYGPAVVAIPTCMIVMRRVDPASAATTWQADRNGFAEVDPDFVGNETIRYRKWNPMRSHHCQATASSLSFSSNLATLVSARPVADLWYFKMALCWASVTLISARRSWCNLMTVREESSRRFCTALSCTLRHVSKH